MPDPSTFELISNPSARRDRQALARAEAVLDATGFAEAYATITAWPGYAPTPLVPLAGFARAHGVGTVHYKNEATRFGLGSFKALGGAYAVWRVLVRTAAEKGITPDDKPAFAAHASGLTVASATDGNHGRSVAWGAERFGCQCVIFIHEKVSETRKAEIERYGARVVRCAGNYDDSVRMARDTAAREGWTVVSDTSYPGYTQIPTDVMQGYALMAEEAVDQWPHDTPPSHVFVQTGVGGLAAAVAAQLCRRYGADRPVIVLADPLKAACWCASVRAGRPVVAGGDLDTLMAGLACGEVSLLAWQVLETAADAVIGLADSAAVDGMRLLAEGRDGDPPLVAGESAVAGLMALKLASDHTETRARLALGPQARVLVFGTEGATDPGLYRALVGRDPAEVEG